MSDIGQLFMTAAISGSGLLCSGSYLLREVAGEGDLASWWFRLDSTEGALRRKRRRHLGMAVVALLSIFFFIGINFVDPRVATPVAYLTYWIVILLLLVWLCLLAFNDLRHTRALLQRLHRQRVDQMNRFLASHPTGDHADRSRPSMR